MQDQTQDQHAVDPYVTPQVIELDEVAVVTLGKYAAVLTSDGCFIADRPDSPSLMKLRAFFCDWEQRGRPGIDALAPVLEPTSDGWQVRVTLARAAG